MNKLKKSFVVSLLLFILVILSLVILSFSVSANSGPTIDATVTKKVLKVGQATSISVKYEDTDSPKTSDVTKKSTFKSLTPNIVSVTKRGKVKALKTGIATIKVKYKKALDFVDIQVGKNILQLTLDSVNGNTIYKDEDVPNLKATMYTDCEPTDVTKGCIFSSNNKSVIKINSNGKLIVGSSGNAKIKAEFDIGSKRWISYIKVNVSYQFSIKFKNTLKKGETTTIICTYKGKKVTKNLTYSSLDKKVVTVTKKGKVKAIDDGVANVSVCYNKTGDFAGKAIQVGKQILTASTYDNQPLKVGSEKDIVVAYWTKCNPKVVTKKAKLSSSNPTVVSILSNGKIQASKKGKATITATYKDLTASFTVDVQ